LGIDSVSVNSVDMTVEAMCGVVVCGVR